MSEITTTLSPVEARRLTDEVKRTAAALWEQLLDLYERNAWGALGYSSWGAYFEAEFGQSGRRGYQLLEAGRTLEVVNQGSLPPPTERQARELAPLLDEPETLREAWAEASANGAPTAAQVREAVRPRLQLLLPMPDGEALERQQRRTLCELLDRTLYVLESPISTAEAQAERLLGPGEHVIPDLSRFDNAIAYLAAFSARLREAGIENG